MAVVPAELQAWPHEPQFDVLVLRFVSHVRFMSQSAAGAVHVVGTQVPLELHVYPVAQSFPQAPQSVSVRSDVSQPSLGSRLQSFQVVSGQVKVQVPETQVGALPWGFVHWTLQEPQWFTSVAFVTSQPFESLPSQFRWAESQLGTHTPAGQDDVAFARLQTLLQPPQVFLS
jgi:hypothetical protein